MTRLVICHTLPALSTALLLTVANAGSATQSVGEAARPSKRWRVKASDYRFRKLGSLAMFAAIHRASSIVSTFAISACAFVSRAYT